MLKTNSSSSSDTLESSVTANPNTSTATRVLRVRFVSLDRSHHTIQLVREAVDVHARTKVFTLQPQMDASVYRRIAHDLKHGLLGEGTWINATLLQSWNDKDDCLYLTDYSLAAEAPPEEFTPPAFHHSSE